MKIDSSVIQHIPNTVSFLPHLPAAPSPFPFTKEPRFQETTKPNKTRYKKKRPKPLHWGWAKQPNSSKRVPRADKSQRNKPPPTGGNSTKHQTNSHNLFAEDLVQTHELAASVSASPYEAYLGDLVGRVLFVSSILFGFYNRSFPSGFPKL